MQTYHILFRLAPASCFGLPDGNKVVIPVAPHGPEILGPALDLRTGQLVSHGTLSQYRTPKQSLNLNLQSAGLVLSINDNFLSVAVDAPHAQVATDQALSYMEVLLQSLTAMYGERFSASALSVQDSDGAAQPVRIGDTNIHYMKVTAFNSEELRDRFFIATNWAATADSAAKKALFYFEHACLLNEFAETLAISLPHASFSRALAFLQLFKALTTIVGDPSSNRDYQRRCKRLGLAKDFWQLKVRPLYDIRNDEDVAHYSHSMPEAGAFLAKYASAVAVFREALEAHMLSASFPAING